MTPAANELFSFAIEISGWDESEAFFVEHTRLEWSAETGERLLIHRPVPSGAVVFLRIVSPTAMDCSFPVAYRVEEIRKLAENGRRLWELRVSQLHACLHSQYEHARAAELEFVEGQCT